MSTKKLVVGNFGSQDGDGYMDSTRYLLIGGGLASGQAAKRESN
jgi:hypothetical protein